jgi:prevent-host-death family protein
METVTIHKAKTELSKLLKRVEAGEEIMIARGNKQIAKISPAETPVKKERVPGAWKGKFTLPDSFFDPMTEEELADWEGPIEPSP